VSFLRWLDRVNLLPGSMIANDPLYSSLFVANLGSIGIDDVYHHLYEYGTTSLFAAIGRVEKGVFVDENGAAVAGARGPGTGKKSTVDKELALATALPTFMLRGVMAFLRWLDRVNRLPASMIASDPMYASAFLANLGGLGIDDTFHHLYEYGTVSLFGAVGRAEKAVFVGASGGVEVRDALKLCWTFDERINDGFYCASSLAGIQRIVEDPAAAIGEPAATADVKVTG